MVKKLLFGITIALLSVSGNVLYAQPQYAFTIATSVANNFPFNDVTNNRRQNLYLPADFPTAPSGAITKLYFQPSVTGSYNFTTLTISMGTTALTSFTTGPWVGGLTNVYTGTGNYTTGTGGWIEIPLTTPFSYNNTQNFIVDVSQTGFAPGFAAIHDGSAGSTNRAMYGNATATTGTQQTRLLRLGFDMQVSCDEPLNIQYNNLTTSSVDISWDPSPGATAYEYQIDQTRTDPPSNGYATVTAPALSLSNLPDGTCYYVHLRTNCSGLFPLSDWSLDSFCTIADCKVPDVVIEDIKGTTAIARWNAVPGVLNYEYSVGTTPNPPTQGVNTTYTNVKLQGLMPNAPLYFYLRAKCSPTPLSPWGVTPFHTTVGTGIDDIDNTIVAIYAFPNPVKDQLAIHVTGITAANATIQLTDVAGRVIMTQPVTSDKCILNTNTLTPGLYYVKYTDELHNEVIKINKQ